jgi:hypothetical protein
MLKYLFRATKLTLIFHSDLVTNLNFKDFAERAYLPFQNLIELARLKIMLHS